MEKKLKTTIRASGWKTQSYFAGVAKVIDTRATKYLGTIPHIALLREVTYNRRQDNQ